ncbi:hypothetical protein [Geobacillus kaustophilus]|uniref:hypothetical protein n=1 Tax=Geobacillus kaustophilus TaxID=1462 RepID=UPI0005CCEF9B|nr:hypothetical protein [Geobacillus kaustophilus]
MDEWVERLFDELRQMRTQMATKEDVARLNGRIERLEQTVAATREDVAALDERIGTIERTMATKEDVVALDGRIGQLEETVAANRDDIAALDNRIKRIEQTMATKEDVAELPFIRQAVVETLETLRDVSTMKQTVVQMQQKIDEIITGQARQELVLQSLALHLLEHESEIRALKAR